jgi:hypothetical protein
MFKKGDIICIRGDTRRQFKIESPPRPSDNQQLKNYVFVNLAVVKTFIATEEIGKVYVNQLISDKDWETFKTREHNHPLTKIFK